MLWTRWCHRCHRILNSCSFSTHFNALVWRTWWSSRTVILVIMPSNDSLLLVVAVAYPSYWWSFILDGAWHSHYLLLKVCCPQSHVCRLPHDYDDSWRLPNSTPLVINNNPSRWLSAVALLVIKSKTCCRSHLNIILLVFECLITLDSHSTTTRRVIIECALHDWSLNLGAVHRMLVSNSPVQRLGTVSTHVVRNLFHWFAFWLTLTLNV